MKKTRKRIIERAEALGCRLVKERPCKGSHAMMVFDHPKAGRLTLGWSYSKVNRDRKIDLAVWELERQIKGVR